MQAAALQRTPRLHYTLPGPSPFDLYTWIIHQINKQPISLPVKTRQSLLSISTTGDLFVCYYESKLCDIMTYFGILIIKTLSQLKL